MGLDPYEEIDRLLRENAQLRKDLDETRREANAAAVRTIESRFRVERMLLKHEIDKIHS
jgi:hypothetical protein